MSALHESWKQTRAHLRQAHEAAGSPPLGDLGDYLDHNELELAADVLADFGDARDDLGEAFWEALKAAYDNMELQDRAKLCRFRVYESKYGFVEAHLTLTPTADGGRKNPVFTDYRPDWNIGNRAESGEVEINGAPITVEDAPSIPPGGTGLVRLHPLWREAWTKVAPGAELAMHEGPHVRGKAVVLRVTLRDGGDGDR